MISACWPRNASKPKTVRRTSSGWRAMAPIYRAFRLPPTVTPRASIRPADAADSDIFETSILAAGVAAAGIGVTHRASEETQGRARLPRLRKGRPVRFSGRGRRPALGVSFCARRYRLLGHHRVSLIFVRAALASDLIS